MGKLIYLLDTNILSEPVKAKPDVNVMDRLERYDGCYCTAATVWHEMRFGYEKLPPSKLRRHLETHWYCKKSSDSDECLQHIVVITKNNSTCSGAQSPVTEKFTVSYFLTAKTPRTPRGIKKPRLGGHRGQVIPGLGYRVSPLREESGQAL